MDRFAERMTARGPTLGPDRETWTGSLHIVDLPSLAAAREFAEREPYNRAGLFEQHTIRRFRNLLGRTMWDYEARSDESRFLLVADAPVAPPGPPILHGELLMPGDASPAGVALALQAPSRDALAQLGGQVHDWEFGGRR